MFNNYDEIKTTAEKDAASEELQRISREIELFRERNWEPYILFLCNLINALTPCDRFYLDLSKSAMDSYLINKVCDLPRKDKLLKNPNSLDILWNDALRLNIEIIGITQYFKKEIFEIGHILEDALNASGFQYIEMIEPQSRSDDHCELILVGMDKISAKDKEIVINEKRESSDEDAAVLRKYLILHFATRNRL